MADVEYKHDYSALRSIAKGAEMHIMLIDKAAEAKAFAISISPDAPPYGEGYIADFEIDGSHYETINGLSRATVYLRNQSDHATLVEYKDGYHVLSRTIDFLEHS